MFRPEALPDAALQPEGDSPIWGDKRSVSDLRNRRLQRNVELLSRGSASCDDPQFLLKISSRFLFIQRLAAAGEVRMPESQSAPEERSSEHRRYRLLLQITDLVARTEHLPDAFNEIAPPVLELTQSDLLNLSLHDPLRNRILTRYWKKNRDRGEFDSLPVDQAVTVWASAQQRPIIIPDLERDRRLPSTATLLNHGVRSYAVFPISPPSSRLGAVGVGKGVPVALPGEDVEFMSRVALMTALALEKDAARRSAEEQESLLAISRLLASNLQLDKLLPSILASIRGIPRYQQAILSLLDEDGKFVRRYWENMKRVERFEDAVPLEQSILARAVQTRAAVLFSASDLREVKLRGIGLPEMNAKTTTSTNVDSNIDPKIDPNIADSKPTDSKSTNSSASAVSPTPVSNGTDVLSTLSVPLIAGNRVWGVLHSTSTEENTFGPREIEYLEQVGNHIAAALQNSHITREVAKEKVRIAHEKRYFEHELRAVLENGEIVGSTTALKRVLDDAAIVANTDATVLITGETGTGKERIARLIHTMSHRKDRSFIKLNCAAIPTGLLESELFGHEKGAFTGAVSQKIGRLELADKGTLLLDEVGEIPLELQPKLLRVLQDQEFERLGGTKTIRVDVRLISATNRDLARAVEEKQFRGDLFYRLHVFPLHLPALRDRREDIPALIHHFVEKCSARLRKQIDVIPDEAVHAMVRWSWPGNIRELENFIERSVILSDGNRLRAPLGELREESLRLPSDPRASEPTTTLADREREHIIEILRQTRGALSGPGGAAERLGVKRTTLQYKMQRLGISRTDYLS